MAQRLICVARVDGPFALALVLAKLRGAGIWAQTDIFHTATNYQHYATALGGAKVEVLHKDAEAALEVLGSGPPMVSSGLRGWRAILAIFFLYQCGARPSPFAVYLQNPPNRGQVTRDR